MSSGSGSGYATFTGSFGNTSDVSGAQTGSNKCDLNIITHIINPKPNLANKLTKGELLIVALDSDSVTIQNNQGQTIGIIAPYNTNQLIYCINQGNLYAAEIIEINGGYIRVQVSLQS